MNDVATIARASVTQALKDRLEGELATSAYMRHDPQAGAFSRSDSGGGGHSRSGHNFSRAQEVGELSAMPEDFEDAKLAFAKEFLRA